MFPLMRSTQSKPFTIEGKEGLGRQGPVPRRSSIKACCLWRPGTPHIPRDGVGEENTDRGLSDNENSRETSKGRGSLTTLKRLILAQPTCYHFQGVPREEEKPRTPRGCRRYTSCPVLLAQAGSLKSWH